MLWSDWLIWFRGHTCICILFLKDVFFNCNINARPGFRDPENLGKGTKTDFLSPKSRKLWGIEEFCIFGSDGHFDFCSFNTEASQRRIA